MPLRYDLLRSLFRASGSGCGANDPRAPKGVQSLLPDQLLLLGHRDGQNSKRDQGCANGGLNSFAYFRSPLWDGSSMETLIRRKEQRLAKEISLELWFLVHTTAMKNLFGFAGEEWSL
jgi:hypothetical protein